jgi:hypothetical protein
MWYLHGEHPSTVRRVCYQDGLASVVIPSIHRLPADLDNDIVSLAMAVCWLIIAAPIALTAGDECHIYDLLLEVSTDTLVEEAYRLDDFAGKFLWDWL